MSDSEMTPDPAESVIEEAAVADEATADVEDSVEALIVDFEKLAAERDELVSIVQRTQADFENFRKRTMKQQADEVARASGRIIEALLPVLDAFDYASAHGEEQLKPMRDQLLGALEKEGLARLDTDGTAFDPSLHEAVAHEAAEEAQDEPVVSETMRAGYTWRGQLLRPAMVKVKG